MAAWFSVFCTKSVAGLTATTTLRYAQSVAVRRTISPTLTATQTQDRESTMQRTPATILTIALLLTGCGKKDADQPQAVKTGGQTQQPTTTPPKVVADAKPDPAKSEPAFSLTPDAFSSESLAPKYKNQVIDLTAPIHHFGREEKD